MTGPTVPRDLQGVTPSWLTEALHSKETSSSASVTGYSAQTIAGGTGFMNHVVRLRLRYDDDPQDLPRTVIVKLPSTDPGLRMLSAKLSLDRREVRFYQEVATNGHIQIPHTYYGGIDSANEGAILLLEDVSSDRQGDSIAGCSLGEAQHSLVQLAQFQAVWWNSPTLGYIGLDATERCRVPPVPRGIR